MCKYAELIDNSHMCMIDGRPVDIAGTIPSARRWSGWMALLKVWGN